METNSTCSLEAIAKRTRPITNDGPTKGKDTAQHLHGHLKPETVLIHVSYFGPFTRCTRGKTEIQSRADPRRDGRAGRKHSAMVWQMPGGHVGGCGGDGRRCRVFTVIFHSLASFFCPPLPRPYDAARKLIIQTNSVALSPLLPLPFPPVSIMKSSLAVLILVASLAVAQVYQLFRPHPTFLKRSHFFSIFSLL